MWTLLLTLCSLQAAPTARVSTPALPFPLLESELDPLLGVRLQAPSRADLAAFQAHERILMTSVLLPDGSSVAFHLQRIRTERLGLGLFINGQSIPASSFDTDLSLWSGKVLGEPDSEVYLGLSSEGCRGWVRRGAELIHLLSAPGAGGDWSRSSSWWVDERVLVRSDQRSVPFCSTDRLGPSTQRARATGPGAGGAAGLDNPPRLEGKIAMEGDYQLFTRFGSVSAELTYVITLLGAINARFLEQINVLLTFPYLNLWTIQADPWITPDIGGSSYDYLFEFIAAWSGNIPGNAHLAHLLSGANVGGGIAYLDVLCNPYFGFAVSGDLDALMSFPPAPGPLTWDFLVVAHETGHGFGAIHTHDYCPPVDSCAPAGYQGPCQPQTVCTNQGSLMSYCHLCPGGMSNMTLYFHPQSASDMRFSADGSCLPATPATSFCTAKAGLICGVPEMTKFGASSASATNGFVITAGPARAERLGVLVYNTALGSPVPFQGGTLCLALQGLRRGGPTSSLGTAGTCDGVFAIDMNAFAQGLWIVPPNGTLPSNVPASYLKVAGTDVFAQYWGRDSVATGSYVSSGLKYTVGP